MSGAQGDWALSARVTKARTHQLQTPVGLQDRCSICILLCYGSWPAAAQAAVAKHLPDAQEKGMTDLLRAPGKLKAQIPGITGTRNLEDNISDCKAQVGSTAPNCKALRIATCPAVCRWQPTTRAFALCKASSRNMACRWFMRT